MPADAVSVPAKGYTTVHIPAKMAQPKADEKLLPGRARLLLRCCGRVLNALDCLVTTLPEWARDAFPGMKTFNRIQSRVFETAFKGTDNMLMCAPTGAGKFHLIVIAFFKRKNNLFC